MITNLLIILIICIIFILRVYVFMICIFEDMETIRNIYDDCGWIPNVIREMLIICSTIGLIEYSMVLIIYGIFLYMLYLYIRKLQENMKNIGRLAVLEFILDIFIFMEIIISFYKF